MDTEQLLINNTLKGDMDSYSNLVLKYKDRIFAFLLKMTLSKEDAEELLQEVFISVYKNLYLYNSNWSFSTWIYKIAANAFNNFYKKNKRNRNFDNINALDQLSCSFEDYPDIIYEKKEHYAKVVKLINNLKPDQKIALVLKHVKGFSYSEIGKILNISPQAAQMKVQRAKESICHQFKKMERSS
ncbi:RNA polymerase sigma factor [Acetivibrio cellulolyticus]|uniref:RNA polymerase sigma factor n=1 Tax=Acetivibrio cellulolyticus TaxID=35830 RepID=UPI0002481B69|nr:RNA polymerase sigma factor [Acetivibrio cellulolyticus]